MADIKPYERYQKINFADITKRKMLNAHLITPSLEFSYSLCIEYMKDWFLKRFNKDFFGKDFAYVYVDDSHVFDSYNRLKKDQILNRSEPGKGALAIVPVLNDEFNREQLEDSIFGVDMMLKRSRYEDSFFKDKAHDRYISARLTLIQMDFTFKVRVETLAQQLDLAKAMRQTYRVGYTQGEYISMDYALPPELMLSVAMDAGFEVKNGDIVDPIAFLYYMNSNSQLPILYKFRSVNGHNEYFMRMPNMYVWINCTNLQRDQGDRINMLKHHYNIEMNCQVRFPAAHYYILHTESKSLTAITKGEYEPSDMTFETLHDMRQFEYPSVNDRGWNSYLYTDYIDDANKILELDFTEIFQGTEMEALIKHSLGIHVSPELFMEIQIYNDLERQPITIDWEKMTVTTKNKVLSQTTNIVIFMDLNWLNNHRAEFDGIINNRFGPNVHGREP
ncbi:MAG: hypothetical protein J6Y02_10715 [Pseudobutyrivibrio sp.]|nr:hypothetical protein [Pseudobutyrivibrio sp.]